jgi:hypothetical protein
MDFGFWRYLFAQPQFYADVFQILYITLCIFRKINYFFYGNCIGYFTCFAFRGSQGVAGVARVLLMSTFQASCPSSRDPLAPRRETLLTLDERPS